MNRSEDMKINLLSLYSRLADASATAGVSLHQQATWDALSRPDVDAVINMAATGDGKSYAAFGAFPDGGIMALYPTNELVRDQQRQLATYQTQWRVQRVTGGDLERWSREARQNKAEMILDLSDAEVLLTNPDLFYYLHQGNYVKRWQGDRAITGVPRSICLRSLCRDRNGLDRLRKARQDLCGHRNQSKTLFINYRKVGACHETKSDPEKLTRDRKPT